MLYACIKLQLTFMVSKALTTNFLSKAFAVILEYLRTGNWWFAGIPKRQVYDEARFYKIRKRVLVVTAEIEDDYLPGQRVKLG